MDEMLKEKIAKRAYELFLARGGQHGYHLEDWLQAEKEIMQQIGIKKEEKGGNGSKGKKVTSSTSKSKKKIAS